MKTRTTKELVQLSLFVAIIVLMAVVPFLGYIPLGFTRATIIHWKYHTRPKIRSIFRIYFWSHQSREQYF